MPDLKLTNKKLDLILKNKKCILDIDVEVPGLYEGNLEIDLFKIIDKELNKLFDIL